VAHSTDRYAAYFGRTPDFRFQSHFGAADVPIHVSRPMRHVLSISAFYHDSAAALISDGQLIAAAQEERFTRKKNDERFPGNAVQFCLRFAHLEPKDLNAVVFYDKPITKFARMLETYLPVAPCGLTTFPRVL